jgi:ATP-dependent Clp protease ATP-binding subunit ClpC
MFERYTEKARRVVFFARYEASQFGSPYIETEHLLLGLLREDKALTNRFLRSHASVESIRTQIEGHTRIREKVSTSVDLPLSNESKRVLAYAAEEAERLSHKHIGTEHLLLGLLREEKCFAAEILRERGLRLSSVREELARVSHENAQAVQRPVAASPLARFARDLTQAASDQHLDLLIGRDAEVDAIIEVLHHQTSNNPVLVGEPGVGKTAIVEGLALRIAEYGVPPLLAAKKIFAIDLAGLAAGAQHRADFENRLTLVIKEAAQQNAILYIEESATLVGAGSADGSLEAANVLRSALSRREIQCITEATPAEYEAVVQKHPWFARYSRVVKVSPLTEHETLPVVSGLKERFEKFHGVVYTSEALQVAAHHCGGNIGRAAEVLDVAGTRVKLRQAPLPPEILEAQKQIKFILHRMENAIANHEFEKARFYSDEERKVREKLKALREAHKIDESAIGEVTREDVEEAIARPTG